MNFLHFHYIIHFLAFLYYVPAILSQIYKNQKVSRAQFYGYIGYIAY